MADPTQTTATAEPVKTTAPVEVVPPEAKAEIGAALYAVGGVSFVLWVLLIYVFVGMVKEWIRCFIVGTPREKFERPAIQLMALSAGPVSAPLGWALADLFGRSEIAWYLFGVIGLLASLASFGLHWVIKNTDITHDLPRILSALAWNIGDVVSLRLTGKPLGTVKNSAVTAEAIEVETRRRRKTFAGGLPAVPKD